MNAGAYGGEMKQVILSVRAVNMAGDILELPADALDMGYRTSRVQKEQMIVLSAVLKFSRGDAAKISERVEELTRQRKEKQPLEYPSAGSTFKRPEGYFAGKLIDDAGLRGFQVGGAQVSEKHCGFVINRNQATAADVEELCHQVAEKVKEQSGVDLEMEIKRLG